MSKTPEEMANGWISVRDRLPEVNTIALWFNRHTRQYYTCTYKMIEDHGSDWGGYDDPLKLHTFTHWMPLFKPPEEGK